MWKAVLLHILVLWTLCLQIYLDIAVVSKLPFAAFLHIIQNVLSSTSLLLLDLFYGVKSGWFCCFVYFSFLALSFLKSFCSPT